MEWSPCLKSSPSKSWLRSISSRIERSWRGRWAAWIWSQLVESLSGLAVRKLQLVKDKVSRNQAVLIFRVLELLIGYRHIYSKKDWVWVVGKSVVNLETTSSMYKIIVAMASHVVWLVSREWPRLYSFTTTTTTTTPIKKKIFYLWEKKLIKSLLQEPPISKDCLRNSHFLN